MKAFRNITTGLSRAIDAGLRRFAALLAIGIVLALAAPAVAHDDAGPTADFIGAAGFLSLESVGAAVPMPCGIIDENDDCGCIGLGGCHVVMAAAGAAPLDPDPRPLRTQAGDPRFDGCDVAPPIHPPRIAIAG